MEKLNSRKFWVAVVTALLVVANQGLDLKLPEDAIMKIVQLAMIYIFGQGAVDFASGLKK